MFAATEDGIHFLNALQVNNKWAERKKSSAGIMRVFRAALGFGGLVISLSQIVVKISNKNAYLLGSGAFLVSFLSMFLAGAILQLIHEILRSCSLGPQLAFPVGLFLSAWLPMVWGFFCWVEREKIMGLLKRELNLNKIIAPCKKPDKQQNFCSS